MQVWAFNRAAKEEHRVQIRESLSQGKSRFGWSHSSDSNLNIEGGWSNYHSKNLFLKEIKKDDWIVHINTPTWGECTAAQVTKGYDFDDGLKCDWGDGVDFRHCFEVDPNTVIQFGRRDPNILPSVNLNPRYRYHRIYAVEDFLTSINNLKGEGIELQEGERPNDYHLRDKTKELLPKITELIQEMNRSKQLEAFLANVFKRIPGVDKVIENGQRGGTDHGADLIIELTHQIGPFSYPQSIIVQVKSYTGNHSDTHAVDQIIEGMNKYKTTSGILLTTASRTPELESYIQDQLLILNKDSSDSVSELNRTADYTIDLIDKDEFASFVIKYASDLIF